MLLLCNPTASLARVIYLSFAHYCKTARDVSRQMDASSLHHTTLAHLIYRRHPIAVLAVVIGTTTTIDAICQGMAHLYTVMCRHKHAQTQHHTASIHSCTAKRSRRALTYLGFFCIQRKKYIDERNSLNSATRLRVGEPVVA